MICVTLQDLNRYLDLVKQLNRARESLLDLQEAAVPGAQKLTGMPHTPGVSDKVGNLAIEIADTKTAIGEMEQERAAMQTKIEAFITTIPDVELRTIFRLRYVRILSWDDIEEVFRWRYSKTAIRRRAERYIATLAVKDDACGT